MSINFTIRYILLLFFVGCIGVGCNKESEKAPVPTYVHVDSFTFTNNPLGTSSHRITAVWAYYNNSPVGVFDLPATFPVITDGDKGRLTLVPAIPMDGLNNFLTKYPFYKSDTSTLVSQPGKTINYTPVTGYYASVKFKKIADFNGITGFKLYSGSVPFVVDNATGSITLNRPNDTLSEDSSMVNFSLTLGQDAYIELDYKNTIPFYLGLQANLSGFSQKVYLSGVNPVDNWRKFYLSLKDFEGQYQASNYTLYIKTYLGSDQTTGKVLLDNIQLVYFE